MTRQLVNVSLLQRLSAQSERRLRVSVLRRVGQLFVESHELVGVVLAPLAAGEVAGGCRVRMLQLVEKVARPLEVLLRIVCFDVSSILAADVRFALGKSAVRVVLDLVQRVQLLRVQLTKGSLLLTRPVVLDQDVLGLGVLLEES